MYPYYELAKTKGYRSYTDFFPYRDPDYAPNIEGAEVEFRKAGFVTCRVPGNRSATMLAALADWEPTGKEFSWYFVEDCGVMAFSNEVDAVNFRMRWEP